MKHLKFAVAIVDDGFFLEQLEGAEVLGDVEFCDALHNILNLCVCVCERECELAMFENVLDVCVCV